jgi:hypothetical protein
VEARVMSFMVGGCWWGMGAGEDRAGVWVVW